MHSILFNKIKYLVKKMHIFLTNIHSIFPVAKKYEKQNKNYAFNIIC